MEFFNYSANISFLVFAIAITMFGAKEKTIIRAAWFSIALFMMTNLIHQWNH